MSIFDDIFTIPARTGVAPVHLFDAFSSNPLGFKSGMLGGVSSLAGAYLTVLVPLAVARLFFPKSEGIRNAFSTYTLPLKFALGAALLPVKYAVDHCLPGFVTRFIERRNSPERVQARLDRKYRFRRIGSDIDRLLVGGEENRRAFAEKFFPPDKYSFLYTENVPEGVRLSVIMHGRLLNGWDVSYLGWRHTTIQIISDMKADAAIVGARMGWLFFLATAFLCLSSVGAPFEFPSWTDDFGPHLDWYLAYALGASPAVLAPLLAAPLFGYAVAVGAFARRMSEWRTAAGANLAIPTRDSWLAWSEFEPIRDLLLLGHRRQVKSVTERTKGDPVVEIAIASGYAAMMGLWNAYRKGMKIRIDAEGFRLHFLIQGSTGSMKTYMCLIPISLKVLKEYVRCERSVGAFITDGKNVLSTVLLGTLREMIASGELPKEMIPTVLGLKEGQKGCNLFAGLSPAEIAKLWQDCYGQLSKGGNDSTFFLEHGALLVLNAAVIMDAVEQDPETWSSDDQWRRFRPVSVAGINWMCDATDEMLVGKVDKNGNKLSDGFLDYVIKRRIDCDHIPALKAKLTSDDMNAALDYYMNFYIPWYKETKDSVKAQVSVVTGAFRTAGILNQRFGTGLYGVSADIVSLPNEENPDEVTVNVSHDRNLVADVYDAFTNMGIVFEDIPEEYGKAAMITKTILEKRIISRMKWRLANDLKACKEHTVFVIKDEMHLTASKSDPEDYSILRQGGGCLIGATQSISALLSTYGPEGAVSFCNNVQNKIILKNSDTDMIEGVCKTLGTVKRGKSALWGGFETQAEREAACPDVGAPYVRDDGFDIRDLFIGTPKIETGHMARAAAVDLSFVPEFQRGNGGPGNADAILAARKEAHQRADDKEEERLGNVEDVPLLAVQHFRRGNALGFVETVYGNETRWDLADLDIDGRM